MKFSIKWKPDNQDTLALMKEWKERAVAVRQKISYDMAQAGLKDLLGRIPETAELSDYRKSMEVASVLGPKNETQYTIQSNPKSSNVRKIDIDTTVIYVQPKRALKRPNEAVKVLQKFSPWTPDTLPFQPKAEDAVIISRKVRKGEATKIRQSRIKDKPEWSSKLTGLGIKVALKNPLSDVKSTLDTVTLGMSLEFGLGRKAIPHWRPTMKYLSGEGGNKVLKNPEIGEALGNFKFVGWKKWGSLLVKGKIDEQKVNDLAEFSKKLFKEL